MDFEVKNINIFDLINIEKIGKACLPIYYKVNDMLFLLFNKNYIMYKICYNNEIIGFIVANIKYKPNYEMFKYIDTNVDNNKKYEEYENYKGNDDLIPDDNLECTIKKHSNLVNRLHIMSIGVLPKYRKKGFGTVLIKEIKKYIKKNYSYPVKMSLFVLTNNLPAIKLYERNGFKKKYRDEEYYETLPIKSAYYYET